MFERSEFMIGPSGFSSVASAIFRSKAYHLMVRARAAAMMITMVAPLLVHGQVPVARIPHAPGRQQFSVGQIADSIRPSVRQAVEETNRMLLSTGSSPHLELSSTGSVFTQTTKTTFYSDRPNHPFVSLGIFFPVNVKLAGIDFSVSRNIGVILNLFCDGGQTGQGSVRVELSRFSRAKHPNSFDDIFQHLDDQVGNRVTAVLAANPALQGKCVAVDAAPSYSQSPATLITITPPLPTSSIKGVVPSPERIHVTFLSIKRLPAHELKGGKILYQPVENILLETWVNFTSRELGVFSMKEGDMVNLNLPPLELDAPPSQFQIIVNVFQLPSASVVDSTVTGYERRSNYSPGVRVLRTVKTDPTNEENFSEGVPAYEITYSLAYTSGKARISSSSLPSRDH
jgi:hypothetical protein